jgi:hypothetical protein
MTFDKSSWNNWGNSMAKTLEITNENRDLYGGDYRIRQASTDKYGNVNRTKPTNTTMTIANFGPGDIINKSNPELEFAVTPVEMSGSPSANTIRMYMVQQGYQFCNYDEWDLRPSLRDIWLKDAEGKIASSGGAGYTLALMWCPKEKVEARAAETRRFSDEIEGQFKETLALDSDRLKHAGAVDAWASFENEVKESRASNRR